MNRTSGPIHLTIATVAAIVAVALVAVAAVPAGPAASDPSVAAADAAPAPTRVDERPQPQAEPVPPSAPGAGRPASADVRVAADAEIHRPDPIPAAAPIGRPTERVLATDANGAKFNAADPALVREGDEWLLFTTQGALTNVPVWRSDDLSTWTWVGDALPELPGWAEFGLTWAPDVARIGDHWVLFFTAHHRASGLQCIGHGVADSPIGPFAPFDRPIVCDLELGGSIDPQVFIDADDQPWLLWKVDANAIDGRSELRSQALTADGTELVGGFSTLLQLARSWEGPLIEQPELVDVDGVLHLFYAGNWYNQPEYQIGHAICESVTGPCERTTDDAGWITTRDDVKGPGALSVEQTDEGLVGVYHAWIGEVAVPGEFRSLVVEPVDLTPAGPVAA